MRLSLTYLEVFTQKRHLSFKMAQGPPCLGIRRSILKYKLSFLKYNPCQAVVALRAVLRNLFLRNLILGVFIRITLICSPE